MAPKTVAVAGGGKLILDSWVPGMQYKIQGNTFASSFKVLPLVSYDVILGADWIFHHSPIYMDLIKGILIVTKNGHSVVLRDFTQMGEQSVLLVVQL